MSSLRARLGGGLGALLAAVLSVFLLLFYGYVRHVLLSEFDAGLQDKARLFAAGSEEHADGTYEFEMIEAKVPEFWPGEHAEYVQIWRIDGTVVLRSPSLAGRDLTAFPPDGTPKASNLALPDGRRGRLITFGYQPHADMDLPPRDRPAHMEGLRIAFAVSRVGVANALARILAGLLLGALILAGGVFGVLWFVVPLGLRPLERIAAQANNIGVSTLGQRFAEAGLPKEIQPIAARLNDLLARLETAFARERRFTADAAHELRTPVAELRALAEVGLLEIPPHDNAARGYLNDARSIAQHLEDLIAGLLALARLESGSIAITPRNTDLAAMLRRALDAQNLASRRPDLALDANIPETAPVYADENLTRILLDNVIANVAAHTALDGVVSIALVKLDDTWRLQISNTANDLHPADLVHLAEPFWRKSPDRTDAAHAGLGLALVAECARLMRVALKPTLVGAATFCLETTWRAAPLDL